MISAMALIFMLPILVTAKTYVNESTEVFDSGPGEKIQINVGRGNVEVSSHPGNEVTVDLSISLKAKNQEAADEAFKSVETVIQQSDGKVLVKVKQKNSGSFLNFSKPPKAKIKLIVLCPEDYNVEVDTGSGNIIITGINGKLEFDTGSGNIIGNQLNGKIDADTGSGNIVLTDTEGHFNGDTGSGNIVANSHNGSISADTGSGNIQANGSISKFNADTGSGNVSIVSKSAIAENSKADTGSGNISLALPASSSFELNAETNSGRIANNFPVAETFSSGKKHIHAKINQGGPVIRADAGSGNVSIRTNH